MSKNQKSWGICERQSAFLCSTLQQWDISRYWRAYSTIKRTERNLRWAKTKLNNIETPFVPDVRLWETDSQTNLEKLSSVYFAILTNFNTGIGWCPTSNSFPEAEVSRIFTREPSDQNIPSPRNRFPFDNTEFKLTHYRWRTSRNKSSSACTTRNNFQQWATAETRSRILLLHCTALTSNF